MLFRLLIILLAAGSTVLAAETRIVNIRFNGNRVTKEPVVRHFLGIDTGMVFDSVKIGEAKRRLEATGLFMRVALVPVVRNDSVDLYVIVKESVYLRFSSLDLSPYTSRYGERGTWYSPLVGVERSNFRGELENLRLMLRGPEWQTAAASWSKPILTTPYFIGLSAFYDQRPDNALPHDRMEIAGSLTLGRKVCSRSKAYISISPDFQRNIIHTAANDTTRLYQTFGTLGWFTDARSSAFDPASGWSFQSEARSNFLYVQRPNPTYLQLMTDSKLYHRGLFANDKMAYRVWLVSRTNDAGIQNRLTLGGVGSVRGYANCGIDLRENANSSLLLSAEYRFPIAQLKSTPVPFPAGVSNLMGRFFFDPNDIAPRIDGALIVDYGKTGRYIGDIAERDGNGSVSGMDAGFGIRVMEPSLRQSGCFDVVWVEDPSTRAFDFLSRPSLNLYINLAF
ncbi:MAG: BamA/TamA family outer membrane protein [Chitinispirillaceae bacterium]|jgi:outer membrane protein assembly factor BamA|nr:BamA/TamA family outer membrane protein [Chitinispirillaceae bacterium]